jgi:hypothetical protein
MAITPERRRFSDLKNRILIAAVAVGALLAGFPEAFADPPRRPNIVFILADDKNEYFGPLIGFCRKLPRFQTGLVVFRVAPK